MRIKFSNSEKEKLLFPRRESYTLDHAEAVTEGIFAVSASTEMDYSVNRYPSSQ